MKIRSVFSCLASFALAGAAMADVTHRYSFDADASDSEGTAHGTVEGAGTWVGGDVWLSGQVGPQASWTPTGAAPVAVGGRLEVTIPVSSGPAFYQLKKD